MTSPAEVPDAGPTLPELASSSSAAIPQRTLEADDSSPACLSSLLFWIFLLCAIGLYAGIALAPKLWTYVALSNKYATGQARLAELQKQIDYLESVASALQHDPEFAAELARAELAARRPGEEHIAVDKTLAWDTRRAEMLQEVPPEPLPWYASLLRLLAENNYIRTTTLVAAAVIVVLSFTFLHESQTARLRSVVPGLRGLSQRALSRYRPSVCSKK